MVLCKFLPQPKFPFQAGARVRTWLQKSCWNHRNWLRIPSFSSQTHGQHFQKHQEAGLPCSQCPVLLDVLNRNLKEPHLFMWKGLCWLLTCNGTCDIGLKQISKYRNFLLRRQGWGRGHGNYILHECCFFLFAQSSFGESIPNCVFLICTAFFVFPLRRFVILSMESKSGGGITKSMVGGWWSGMLCWKPWLVYCDTSSIQRPKLHAEWL